MLFTSNASATVFHFEDTWKDWNNDSAYKTSLKDENGTPKLHSMDVTVIDGYLTKVDLFLNTSTGYQEYNSLFINTSWDGEKKSFDAWDYLVHDGGRKNGAYTKGAIAKDGLHAVVNPDYKYTLVKGKNRIGNPNGIHDKNDSLQLIDKKLGAVFSDVTDIPDYLQYGKKVVGMLSYDFSKQKLAVKDGFFVAYAPWCANDVIGGGSDVAPVPEPATMLLFGTGLVGIAGAARRNKKKNTDA